MSHVNHGRTCSALSVVTVLVLLALSGCDQGALTNTNNSAAAEKKKDGTFQTKEKPSETLHVKSYQGEEADAFLLTYFSDKLENNEILDEKELALVDRLRERQEKRRTLRKGPPLLKGRTLIPKKGEMYRPQDLDLDALAEHAAYPYLAFISSRHPGKGKPGYRYDVRGLHFPEGLLEDAVGTRTATYRFVARDAEGAVQFYVEAHVPKAQRVVQGLTQWAREWVAKRHGSPQAASKTDGLDCQYDQEFDGYICEEIVVVCEGNYDDCNLGDQDGSGDPPDPVSVPSDTPEGSGSGGSSPSDNNGFPDGMTPEEALDTVDLGVTVSIVIEETRDPMWDSNVLSTEVDISGIAYLNIINPEGIPIAKKFEATVKEIRKLVEGPIEEWKSIGLGVKGFSISIPIPLDGYAYHTEERTRWQLPGVWTNDSHNEVETFSLDTICTVPEVEKTWKVEATGAIKLVSINGSSTNLTRSDLAEDNTGAPIACRYVTP